MNKRAPRNNLYERVHRRTAAYVLTQGRLKAWEWEGYTAWGDGRAAPCSRRRFEVFFLLLLGNLKQHNQLLLIQMDWINLILVQGHESGWRKLGRGVRWWWGGAGGALCVGDEAWKEMKLDGGEGGGGSGECELNAERIRINDDKICFLFPIFFLSSLWDRRKTKPNVGLYMTHAAIRYSLLQISILRYFPFKQQHNVTTQRWTDNLEIS